MATRPTILIFGISSFVGSNLAEYLRKDYRIVGTYYNTRVEIPGILTIPCDVLDRDKVQLITHVVKPDIVIYAVGLSSLIDAHNSKDTAHSLNASGVFNVTTFSERIRAKFCYISSGYIFSGENKTFHEGDTPLPNTVYGTTIASAEFYIQKSCLNYLVLRSCPLYGRSYNPFQMTLLEMIERNMHNNVASTLDNRIYTGFLDVYYFVQVIKRCFQENVTNRLLQVSTTDIINRYEFGLKYAQVFGLNEQLILSGRWPFPIDELAARDYGRKTDENYYKLSTENLENIIGVKMPMVEQSLQGTFKRFRGQKTKTGHKKTTGITYV